MRTYKLLGIILFFLAFLAGCSSTNFTIKVKEDLSGKIRVCHLADQSTFSELIPGAKIISESFSKRDFLFFVQYKLEVTFGFLKESQVLPEGSPPIDFLVILPGTITKTNASRIKDNNTAIWEFSPGKKFALNIESRLIRWWLIILGGVIILGFAFKRLGK